MSAMADYLKRYTSGSSDAAAKKAKKKKQQDVKPPKNTRSMHDKEECVLDETISPIKKPLHSSTSLIKVSSKDLLLSPHRTHIQLGDSTFHSPDLFDSCPSASFSQKKRPLNENTSMNKSQDLFGDEIEEILIGIPDVSLNRTLPLLSSTPNRYQVTITGDPFRMLSPIRKEIVEAKNLSLLPTPPPSNQQNLWILTKSRSPSPEIIYEQISTQKPSTSTATTQNLRKRTDSGDSQATKTRSQRKVDERTELLKKRGLRDGQVIRKREDRLLMHGTDCACCSGYYNALDLSPGTRKKRLNQVSRHRYVENPLPPTPEHYWEVDFPSTQELERRGLIHRTRAVKTSTSAKKNLFK